MSPEPIDKSALRRPLAVPAGTIERENFFVLSGCSGGGKSTLIEGLARQGFRVVPEPGRQIVQEQRAIEGHALPGRNLELFLQLALSRYMHSFLQAMESDQPVFFDRSVVDAMQPHHGKDSPFYRAASKFRYHRRVFLLPPWQAIYRNDSERQHSFEDAVSEYEHLKRHYQDFGYKIELVPKVSVEERVRFITQRISP